MKIVSVVTIVWLTACARPATPTGRPHETAEDMSSNAETMGRTLADQGRFLEASFYLEAAIAQGTSETEILPLLIAVQIHGDRLRAAKQNALRLREISEPSPSLDALIGLLFRYTPAIDSGEEKEIQP